MPTLDEQAQLILAKLPQLSHDPRFHGRSVKEVALLVGANERLATRVAELWTGSDPIG